MSPSPVFPIGIVPTEKACWECEVVKPMSHFAGHGFAADGKQSTCKWCVSIRRWRSAGILGDFPIERPTTCEICGKWSRNLYMDHCHRTGYLRGFVCNVCNTGMGALGDTAERLRAATDYLERAEARIAGCTSPEGVDDGPDLGKARCPTVRESADVQFRQNWRGVAADHGSSTCTICGAAFKEWRDEEALDEFSALVCPDCFVEEERA